MLPDITQLISSDNSFLIYTAILVSLLLGGFGLPIPEDLPVLIAGVVAAKGAVSLTNMALLTYFGVVVADLMIYGMGYKLGPKLVDYGTNCSFLPAITEERVERIRQGLIKRRFLCIFLGRHLFPIRSVTFLTAGALRVPFLEFLVSDLIAALISVTLVMSIGYYIGDNVNAETLHGISKNLEFYAIIATILVSVLCLFLYKKRKLKKLKN